MGFRSLQHARDRRSTCRGACQATATFRPQGLVTLSAVYSLRARAGLVSCRRRSWDSPFGAFSSRKVSAAFPGGRTHMPFLPSVFPAPKRWAGPTGRGFWALTLPGVPRGSRRISAAAAGCSLGLRPLRVSRKRPRANPRPRSSHALRGNESCDRNRGRLGVSVSLDLASSTADKSAGRTGQPSQGSCTGPDLSVRAEPPPGLLSSPSVASCITVDRRRSYGGTPRSTGATRAVI